MTEAGAVEGTAATPLPLSTPRPGWAEQHPDTWWDASLASIRQLLAPPPVGATRTGCGDPGPDALLSLSGRGRGGDRTSAAVVRRATPARMRRDHAARGRRRPA